MGGGLRGKGGMAKRSHKKGFWRWGRIDHYGSCDFRLRIAGSVGKAKENHPCSKGSWEKTVDLWGGDLTFINLENDHPT